jgi:hypothetical protein
MSDLRTELDAALQTVVPGPPPVEGAMRDGHRIRRRRRVTAAGAALAVAVAIAAGYPALAHKSAGRAPTPPVTHQGNVITDTPPGPGAPPGTIAQGQVGTARWQVTAARPGSIEVTPASPGSSGKSGGASPPRCFSATIIPGAAAKPGWYAYSPGSSLVPDVCDLAYPRAPSSPVLFSGVANDAYQVIVGIVATDVTYVVVTLGDQRTLKLVPVEAYGARLVAYVLPLNEPTLSATALLNGGDQEKTAVPYSLPDSFPFFGGDQEKTAVPYSLPDSFPFFGLWLNPGQPGPPLANATLASGTTGGNHWSMVAHEGPWGTCFDAGLPNLECVPLARLATTSLFGALGSSPRYFLGAAAPSVSRVIVTLKGGGSLRVPAVAVGNEKLWAFALAKGQAVSHWTAYNGAGARVASGSGVASVTSP